MKRITRKQPLSCLEELCSEVRPEDGLSPRELERRHQPRRRKPNHHTFQLCKQVRVAIDSAILCDCGDPRFDLLTACWVDPIPGDSSSLLVTFGVRSEDPEEIEEIFDSLTKVSGLIRSAVAESICRKKAPQLKFRLQPVASSDLR